VDQFADTTAASLAAERMRVLLVEDDDGDAMLVEEELDFSDADVELTRVRTLAEAVGTGLAAFDCVLLDLNLPDTQGLAGLRELRAVAPQLAVLVLTGFADERRGVEAVAAGAQDYLVKGTTSGALLARSLRYAVERRRAELTQQQLSIAQLEARENARLERGLLPAPLVHDPALSLATHYRPGRRRALLGGDFFDAVQVPDGTVHVVIGDVSGHGPDEAALGVCLRIAWRTLVMAGAPPGALLAHLQEVQQVERLAEHVFTTLCMVSIRPDRAGAVVRLAGHPPPLLLADTGVAPLDPGPPGPPLGIVDDAHWPAYDVALPGDWSLLLYTDGVMDGRVGAGQARLGEEGLAAVVDAARSGAEERPEELVRLVVERAEDLNAGPLADDVALLLVARRGT
jgi:serine phosphatase RsbU (regulator of sigma subunit)